MTLATILDNRLGKRSGGRQKISEENAMGNRSYKRKEVAKTINRIAVRTIQETESREHDNRSDMMGERRREQR